MHWQGEREPWMTPMWNPGSAYHQAALEPFEENTGEELEVRRLLRRWKKSVTRNGLLASGDVEKQVEWHFGRQIAASMYNSSHTSVWAAYKVRRVSFDPFFLFIHVPIGGIFGYVQEEGLLEGLPLHQLERFKRFFTC